MIDTIQTLKKDIDILQEKLQKLEEQERTKCRKEMDYKRVYGEYPNYNNPSQWEMDSWDGFFRGYDLGYSAAQKDYKVGEYQETAQEPKPSMTNCMIEGNPPNGYSYWDEWYNELGSKGILHNLRISAVDYQQPPQTSEEVMEKLGFVKNSYDNWTAQPLVETAQERGEKIHKEVEESDTYEKFLIKKYNLDPQKVIYTPQTTEQ